MGNEYSKQVQNKPTSHYRARDFSPSQGTTCVGCHPTERYCVSEECTKETLSWKDRGIAQQSAAKGPEQNPFPDSELHGQRPFINYSNESNNDLRITAAFSLNYSAHESHLDSMRKVPSTQSSEELNFSSTQPDVVSKLLPGGFTTPERKARWKYDLLSKSGYRSHTEPRVILQDRRGTAYKNSLFPNGYWHEATYSNEPNDFYVRSGSKNPTSSSISKSNSSAIWSVKKPTNWKPVTDLLWSYQPNGRLIGDTTIPTFPIFSYGDRFHFNESTTSTKRTGGHPSEQDHVNNPNTPRHSKSIPGPGNVYYEMSHEQTKKRMDPHKATECMRREEITRRPFDYPSFEQSHRLRGSSDGQPSSRNWLYTRASLLSNDPEGGILRDMSCRGMPSSLSIGYPKDAATLRQERSTKGRPTNVIDPKNWPQAHNDKFGFPGSPYPKEQPRSSKEFIQSPPSNSPGDQLSRIPPLSKVYSVYKSPSVAEIEPMRPRQSAQVPQLDSGRLQHQNISCDHHGKAMDPQAKRPTALIIGTETRKYGDGIKPRSFPKPEEFHESVAVLFRSSQSHADHVKVPLATVSSDAGFEDRNSWKTGEKPANRSTAVGEPRISLESQANTVNQGGPSNSFRFSLTEETRLGKIEIKRERMPPVHSTSASAVYSSSVHSDGAIQQPRFNWDSFTLSQQRKSLMESLSNEKRPATSSERLFMSEEISSEKVGPDRLLAESSHTLAFETEGTDSSSNTDSNYGAVGSSNSLASNEESDDEEGVIVIQEKKDEGLEDVGKPTTKKPTCDICGKNFTRNNTLISHKRIHSGARPYSCDQCGRTFRQQGNLTRHMLTHTNIKNHTCSYCNKKFSRASNLHTHLRIHTDYRPFRCDICDKSFYQRMDLKVHRYTHTGEKPHVCSKCGKGFKQVTHLKYHLRIHSDVRMFICEYCGKGFNQKGNLQAHIYGHTGDRPHKCDMCGKAFTLASTLNTHKRTHAATKPFQCKFCSNAYYQKNALKTHYISTHPVTSGFCNV